MCILKGDSQLQSLLVYNVMFLKLYTKFTRITHICMSCLPFFVVVASLSLLCGSPPARTWQRPAQLHTW